MTTGILALIILIAILAQAGIAVLIGLKRRQRRFRELNGRESGSGSLSRPPISPQPTPTAEAWSGYREFSVQRREFEDKDQSICSFYLVPADGLALPSFLPGQFLTFRLVLEGGTETEPRTLVRCYSLSDAPRPDHYRVSIKRVQAPPDRPDLPPGVSSGFFHAQVQEGDRLMVKAPSGHFHLIEDEPLPIVLIGGGIGITPMLSILNSVLERGIEREIWLYYGVRNGREHIMKEHLQMLAGRYSSFHLHVCYSAPDEQDVQGRDYDHQGRVDVKLLRNTLKSARFQFYVCGPKPMMESLVPGLEEWGVDSRDIHYESFGPATLVKRKQPAQVSQDGRPVTVTFSRSGKRLTWDPSVDSLLELAEANAVDVVSGCRAGSCGSCQTALTAGEVDYNQQPDADIAPGHCLLCITRPRSDIVLQA